MIIRKINMLTDKDCITCAILSKVFQEYSAKHNIEFSAIESNTLPQEMRPVSTPAFHVSHFNNEGAIIPGALVLCVDTVEQFERYNEEYIQNFLKINW